MEANLENSYLALQSACGIKIGSKVKVLRAAESHELGWNVRWAPDMDSYVGNTYTVTAIRGSSGFELDHSYWFPFFVLEPVRLKPIRIEGVGEHTAVVGHSKVVVGCQSIPHDKVLEIVEAIKTLNIEGIKPTTPPEYRMLVKGELFKDGDEWTDPPEHGRKIDPNDDSLGWHERNARGPYNPIEGDGCHYPTRRKIEYRFLKADELIGEGDEFIANRSTERGIDPNDSTLKWEARKGHIHGSYYIGQSYSPGHHCPTRRLV